jgi:hypothetical protein
MQQKMYRRYVFAVMALLVVAACLQWSGPSSPDKDWLLYAAREWIGGKTLYGSIFESNPPLILWIYTLPAFLAQHVRVTDVHILTCMGLAASTVSIWLSLTLMAFHPQFATDISRRFQLALLLVFILVFAINPSYFADREHMFILCSLPYMLRWMPSLGIVRLPRHLCALTGIMAGIGFCIKPHAMLLFLGLQLLIIGYQRSAVALRSMENICIYTVGAVYVVCAAYATPAYCSVVLPMALAAYSGYNMRINQPFYTAIALLSVAAAFVDFRLRHASPWRRDMSYVACLCLLCLLYALANNGWGYTFLPLFCMVLILIAFAGWDYGWLAQEEGAHGRAVRPFVFGKRACICVFSVYAVAALVTDWNGVTYACSLDSACNIQRWVNVLNEEHAESFGTITMDFNPWTQIARTTKVKWQTRFNHLWMMPALITGNKHFTGMNAWIPAYVAAALADDMSHNKPEIVFVDTSPQFYTTGKHIDLAAYFSAYPKFRRAWQQYSVVTTVNFCSTWQKKECHYTVYKRDINN